METTSSIASIPTYPFMFDSGLGEATQRPDLPPDAEASFTQPVARRPIAPQCGAADDDDGAIEAFGQLPDERATHLSFDGDLGSPRPL